MHQLKRLFGTLFAIDSFAERPSTRAHIFQFQQIFLFSCRIQCAKYAYMTDLLFECSSSTKSILSLLFKLNYFPYPFNVAQTSLNFANVMHDRQRSVLYEALKT